ncbi:MAG TPA: ABC transporter permease [Vicinamibacterales bacterium]|nr:ABC transporter permease [Vicinamibacterales bacterium]
MNRLLHIVRSRVRSILFRDRREDDLAEELRLHIEQQAEQWIAQGADPAEARQRAKREFGNLESLKEQSRDARGIAAWDAVVRDTRHAARRLLRDWRFSVPAVLLLGLGIGANTAIFSVVNAALFRPSPFAHPDRLVDIYQKDRNGAPGTNSYPAYLDMTTATGVFAHVMAASIPDGVRYRESGGPVRNGVAEYTTASYPVVLGVTPSLGRWFRADEDRQGVPVVAVIGYQAWTTHFAADPSVVGRTLYLQGAPVTIVGVGPQGYRGTLNLGVVTDFWLPVQSAPVLGGMPNVLARRPVEAVFFVKARLRDGVTVAQAQAAMEVLGRRLAAEYPDEDPGKGITVLPANDVRAHPQADTLLSVVASLLLGVVGLVLAIASSNLATLLLVRAAARTKEVSVRLAIGATRWQIVRHLLAESVLLSVAGGITGCVLAWWVLRSLRAFELPITLDFSLDTTVFGFALGLSLATGVLFGLAPALKATRLDLLSVIRDDGHGRVSARRWFTLRNALVAFQVTASVVLLSATGVFLQMIVEARAQRIGFAVDGVATIETDARYSGYTGTRAAVIYDELRRRIAALPGVDAAILLPEQPMEVTGVPVVIDDRVSDGRVVGAGNVWAGPGFFEVMQIPVLFGRALDERDRQGSSLVAVVTESMARQYFGDVNAVGRRFRLDQRPDWIEVVGVVRDTGTLDRGADLVDPRPQLFFRPFEQANLPPNTVVARTRGDDAALARDMQRVLLAMDPSLPVFSALTMTQRLEQSLIAPRAVASSLGALGVLGLVLAGVGLYAVIAFAVSRRTREIGIRMALGARSSDVLRDVARDVAVVLGAGAGIGLVFASLVILAMRAFARPAPGIAIYRPSLDPLQLGAIAVFIVAVGVAAAFIPARRAVRVSPISSLRQE